MESQFERGDFRAFYNSTTMGSLTIARHRDAGPGDPGSRGRDTMVIHLLSLV